MAPILLSLPALHARDVLAISGANQGERLCCDAPFVAGDIYRLRKQVRPRQLVLGEDAEGGLSLAPQTELGQAGAEIDAVCTLSLMAQCGAQTDLILLEQKGRPAMVFAVPVAPLVPAAEYRLVEVDHDHPRQLLAQMAGASFVKGTQITMADGQQRPVETLRAGDTVLTGNSGAQRLRWVGSTTVRAVGALAPVRIEAGALNNSQDLSVSPEQRLLIYQRSDQLKIGRADLMIKARDLLGGPFARVDQGGFVDYHQMLFDQPQIIFAEGIAAETIRVTRCTAAMLPAPLQEKSLHRHHGGREEVQVGQDLFQRSDLIAVLQRAMMG